VPQTKRQTTKQDNVPHKLRGVGKPLSDELREQTGAGIGERPLQQQDGQGRIVADRGDDDIQASCPQPLAAHLTAHSMQDQLHHGRHHLHTATTQVTINTLLLFFIPQVVKIPGVKN